MLERGGLVERNPASRLGELLRRVDRSAASEVKLMDCWSREKVDALLRAVGDHEPRFHPALATLFNMGMRRGELLGLKMGGYRLRSAADPRSPRRGWRGPARHMGLTIWRS